MPLRDLKIRAASGVPFYRQLLDQIAGLIRSGTLPAETKLPSVRDLAKETMVSLITVRRAYADLESLGLIERRQGSGTFVASLDLESTRLEADLEARRILAEAIEKARSIGIGKEELRRHLNELLMLEGEENDG